YSVHCAESGFQSLERIVDIRWFDLIDEVSQDRHCKWSRRETSETTIEADELPDDQSENEKSERSDHGSARDFQLVSDILNVTFALYL
ncbi:hypothetical protein PMAYCL1PPCAC_05263, partial [Pristionchus mayeri]